MQAPASNADQFHTIIIGAGQAGLATGYHLAQRGVDFVILDSAARVGESWRTRWDSLKLFTPATFNNLPGMPFPAARKWHFPGKDATADYLEEYARRHALPIRLGTRVERVAREGDRYVVTAGGRRLEARNVVVATGPFQKPYTPELAAELAPSIRQLHSNDYRNPAQLPAGAALVVGAASSGCEIAIDLVASRRVYLAGRDVPSIPSLVRRTVLRWIASQPSTTPIGKKLHAKARSGGHPIIGFGYKRVTRAGVERVPRVTGVRDGKPLLEDGRVLDVASVVWCTGWRTDFSWIDLPAFEADGTPRHERGVVTDQAGLYFVGLTFLHSLSSQLLLGASRDSAHVAEALLRRSPPDRAAAAPARASGSSA